MIRALRERWDGPGGFGQVLHLAVPLILSTSSHSIKLFVDSVFLAHYSTAAMAAGMLGGLTVFTMASFFVGLTTYVNTFVAQYTGAGRPERVGAAVWQGIWVALGAGAVLLALGPFVGILWAWVGHGEPHRTFEVTYSRILLYGTWAMLLGTTVSGFFTGRSRTWTVFLVHALATVLNLVLDYAWIFGHWGFPAWGVAGAAWATVVSDVMAAGVFVALFLGRRHRERYSTLRAWRPERELFGRLMRFGAANGMQFLLDLVAFSLFVLLVGRIDTLTYEATAMTFRINTLAFLPMVGLGIAVSTLVGQSLGADRPGDARRATWSGFYVSFGFMLLVAVGYWFMPRLFVWPFLGDKMQEASELVSLVSKLLMFVAFYSLFDTCSIIFAGALKGAGDTRFVMMLSVGMSWLLMVLPAWLAVRYGWGPRGGLYVAWGFTTAYVCVLGLAFLGRFLQGKWQVMRVIEAAPHAIALELREPPTAVDAT